MHEQSKVWEYANRVLKTATEIPHHRFSEQNVNSKWNIHFNDSKTIGTNTLEWSTVNKLRYDFVLRIGCGIPINWTKIPSTRKITNWLSSNITVFSMKIKIVIWFWVEMISRSFQWSKCDAYSKKR